MASDRARILITAVDQTKSALESVKSGLRSLSDTAGKLNGALAALGAVASVAGLTAMAKQAIDTADNLNDLAQRTGVSVESLSTLGRVAEQSGADLAGLGRGFKGLSTRLFEAAGGSRETQATFARLGVAFQNSSGQIRAADAVLLDIADRFAAMPDGPEKAALAIKVFGKSGLDLIPLLNQGGKGIQDLQARFRELGAEVSTDTAHAADAFNDQLVELKAAFDGLVSRLTAATLPALSSLADLMTQLALHGEEVTAVLRVLGEVLVATFALKAVAALGKVLDGVGQLRAAFSRFLPVMAAIGVWEAGQGLVRYIDNIREAHRALAEVEQDAERLRQLNGVLDELATGGALSLKSQMWLASHAIERLSASLPTAAEALRAVQGAATQTGEALRQALGAETKKAEETVKSLGATYKQTVTDIKSAWDARLREIDTGFQRESALAQQRATSERALISETAQRVTETEREKLSVIDSTARQMETAWRTAYGQATALARTAGQETQAIEREALDARLSLYQQLESAYRGTVDRLIAEEQRHLNAARAAEEARLTLKLSVEDRIRELARRGMDEQAAYQDRLRQIDEKQAQARAELQRGNFEAAKRLAEEAIQLAERSAGSVTRQVEENGRTLTQTVISDAQAASTAIGQIRESAAIADSALKGMQDAHTQAAGSVASAATSAQRELAGIGEELARLRGQLLAQDKFKLDIDAEAAQAGIQRLKTLVEAQTLVAQIQIDTQAAETSLEKLKNDVGNDSLLTQVELDTRKVTGEIDTLKSSLQNVGVELPALMSFDQPRTALATFSQQARTVLSAPTEARHTPQPDLLRYRAAMSELSRPTSSVHTVYVQRVESRALGGLIQRFQAGGQALTEGFRRLNGRVTGPGTGTSDSIPALLSHGEFVIRAASVQRFGQSFFDALNAGFVPALPRFSDGGLVRQAYQSVQSLQDNNAPAREVVDLRFHLQGQHHTVQSSRQTAMQLASALRELSRGL